ncbi:MAG: acyl-CoA dehydrogenase [Gammaproteobacteria bacterium]|nr:acyl-CoA dehydrogenase [Gammaproteobacteria bacterium]
MDFSLTEEQRQLQDSAEKFIAREYQSKQQPSNDSGGNDIDTMRWQIVKDLGWLGLGVPVEDGGHDGTIVDVMLLQEVLARGPVREPIQDCILSSQLLVACGNEITRSYLHQLISGHHFYVAALYEPAGRYSLSPSITTARQEGELLLISGQKTAVPFGGKADGFIVSTKHANGEIALCLVDSQTPGVSIHSYPTIDGREAAELILKDVAVTRTGLLRSGEPAVQALARAVDASIISLCAEALGSMETALSLTVSYCKQRTQFGRSLSKFQSLQHKMADMYIQCESIRSLLYASAIKHAQHDNDSHLLVSALKYKVAREGRTLMETAVQLHGAIGFTDDYMLGQYYKRVLCIAAINGDADYHLTEYLNSTQRDVT